MQLAQGTAGGTNNETSPGNHLELWVQRWLNYWHGQGEAWQYRYYRCHGCRQVVTQHAIELGGCNCGLSKKVSPARLLFGDKVKLLCVPWTFR